MAIATARERIELPADRIWNLIADFGDTSWMPGVAGVEVQGSGPGMSRLIPAGDTRIREQLESIDAASLSLVYTIPENVPFPVSGYRATMTVYPSGDDACELEWRCDAEPAAGEDAAAVGAQIQGMYTMMIGWIADRAKAL